MDRRWAHIRTSYNKVKQLVTKSGTALPQSQRELDQLIADAYSRCKSSNQRMVKLHIGFQHLRYIFNALDGFTLCVRIDGGTGASSENDESNDDPESESEQVSKAEIDCCNATTVNPSPLYQGAESVAQATSSRSASNKRKRRRSRSTDAELLHRLSRRSAQALDDSLRSAQSARELSDSNHAIPTALSDMTSVDNPLQIIHAFQNTLEAIKKTDDPEDRQLLQNMKRFLGEKFTQIDNSSRGN